MKHAQLQGFLNDHGAKLTIDGRFGPASRAAFIRHFNCLTARAVTATDIARLAVGLRTSPRTIIAVADVEGGGFGWDRNGQLLALYERHYAWRRVRVKVPLLSNPSAGGYTIDADRNGVNDSWEKLALAVSRWGVNTALECASFGKFQVMGAHWKALGYESPLMMVHGLVASEAAHYQMFARFIVANKLEDALRAINGQPGSATAFARGYNGKGQRGYDARIERAYRMAPRDLR